MRLPLSSSWRARSEEDQGQPPSRSGPWHPTHHMNSSFLGSRPHGRSCQARQRSRVVMAHPPILLQALVNPLRLSVWTRRFRTVLPSSYLRLCMQVGSSGADGTRGCWGDTPKATHEAETQWRQDWHGWTLHARTSAGCESCSGCSLRPKAGTSWAFGQVHNGHFSDLLFPGTSTLHTRARYLLTPHLVLPGAERRASAARP